MLWSCTLTVVLINTQLDSRRNRQEPLSNQSEVDMRASQMLLNLHEN